MKQVVTKTRLALAAAVAATLAGGVAAPAAAMPVALSISGGIGLQAYTGSTALNAGQLDVDNVLWTVREQARDGVQSWYLAFDPLNPRRIVAQLDFGAPILAVYTTSRELADTVAAWSVDIDADGVLNDYAARPLMGLEPEDRVNWTLGGRTLALDWRADDPGDHIRVLVAAAQAVPEPGSAALALLALGALGAAARRRR